MGVRLSLRRGVLAGIIGVFVVLLGVTGLAGTIIGGWFGLSSQSPGAWMLVLLIALWAGATATRGGWCISWGRASGAGVMAGASNGLIVGGLVALASALVESGVNVRKWLAQLTPEALRLLTVGHSPLATAVVLLVVLTAAGLVGALVAHASSCFRWRERLKERGAALLGRMTAHPVAGSLVKVTQSRYSPYALGLLLLLAPLVLGQYWNYTLGTVGIYVILGLGLNIVVGMAGLLNLGYVAFYAIGAYSVALLTAPEPHNIGMNFWLVLPIGIAAAAATGLLLGLPVLRTRGDYLAIVTLGFGEIIRILAKSDVLTDFTGGPQGVRAVGGPSLFGFSLNSQLYFMYFILLGVALAAFITSRLQRSRLGRAWMAIREDEDVAEAMGVNTLKYKLLAFAIGAAFAGLGGVLFASRNRYAGPGDFTLLVSVDVLSLVIIGGMGSIPGVVLGALVLKGLPEVLRQLDDYRMLAFGALLIIVMILRPEGLWPAERAAKELREPDE